MKHLLDQMRELRRRLRKTILFLDYDGTLTPIVDRPELAALSPGVQKLLRKAAARHTVVVISGRDLSNIQSFVGVRGIYYVGNHGLEVSGPGVEFVEPKADLTRASMVKICAELRRRLGEIEGAIVEDKGLTVSVHYRLVARRRLKRLEGIVRRVVEPFARAGEVRMTRGKKVFDIRPNIAWDKGSAALWIINTLDPERKLTPVYVGDDKTDEDAFRALGESGITVVVSKKPKKSGANFFLRDVGEVRSFLEALVG
jgi:trehalose-phosphatase